MSNKPEIIFLSTIHRTSERIITAVNSLQKDFRVIVINYGQSSINTNYKSNLRYNKYVSEKFNSDDVYNTSGVKDTLNTNHHKQSDEVISIINNILCNKTVSIIIDDSRTHLFSRKIYDIAKKNNVVVFSNAHGNGSHPKTKDKIYDYLFCLGEYDKLKYHSVGHDMDTLLCSGIPSNDTLKEYNLSNEYILVIANFVYSNPYHYKTLDYDSLKKMKILELQNRLNKSVVFKLKSRLRTEHQKEIDIFRENVSRLGIAGEILYDVDCENSLISRACCVLSYGSTIAFKSIQLNIPTIIFNDLGLLGAFENYLGVVSVGENYDYVFENQFMKKNKEDFLRDTLTGGYDFSSTIHYIESIKSRLKKNVV